MERYTIEVQEDDVPFLQEAAEASGVTVEQELGRLVSRVYAKRTDDDWVNELIAITRPGIEQFGPSRLSWERQVPWEYDDFS